MRGLLAEQERQRVMTTRAAGTRCFTLLPTHAATCRAIVAAGQQHVGGCSSRSLGTGQWLLHLLPSLVRCTLEPLPSTPTFPIISSLAAVRLVLALIYISAAMSMPIEGEAGAAKRAICYVHHVFHVCSQKGQLISTVGLYEHPIQATVVSHWFS